MLTIVLIAYAVIGVSFVAAIAGFASATYGAGYQLDPFKLILTVIFWPIIMIVYSAAILCER